MAPSPWSRAFEQIDLVEVKPWIGSGRTCLTSLVEETQLFCRGPKWTTPFLDSVKNGLPWIGRRGGGLPLKSSSSSTRPSISVLV